MNDLWVSLTTQARQSFLEQDYAQAIQLHLQALEQAQQDFNAGFYVDPDGALAKVLVSYFNLIDGYEAIDKPLVCEQLFENAFDFVQGLNPPEENELQHLSVMHALNIWQKSRYEYLHRVRIM